MDPLGNPVIHDEGLFNDRHEEGSQAQGLGLRV